MELCSHNPIAHAPIKQGSPPGLIKAYTPKRPLWIPHVQRSTYAIFFALKCLTFQLLGATPSLTDALDNTNLVWTTGGSNLWHGQTNVTHDGADAATADNLPDDSETWLRTTVSGVTNISFWWKVSSEPDYDWLEFDVDNTAAYAISGELNWEQRSYVLDPGTHILRWIYVKDPDGTAGSDGAWLDQVTLASIPASAPIILVQPTNQLGGAGGDITNFVSVSAYPFPSYQWRLKGTPISGGTAPALILQALSTNHAGDYTVVVSNSLGSVTSAIARLTVITLPEALNATNLSWTSGGVKPWIPQFAVTHDGSHAAVSPTLTENQDSWLQTIVTGPGNLSFWWKVSSESNAFGFGGDTLSFYIDGILRTNVLGEVNWQQPAFTLTSGTHTLLWRYVKDDSISAGQDRGWLDQVTFSLPPPQPFSLSALQMLSNRTFRFTLIGETGRTYTIQTTTNFSIWSNLTSFVTTSRTNLILDLQTTNVPRRYYRAFTQ